MSSSTDSSPPTTSPVSASSSSFDPLAFSAFQHKLNWYYDLKDPALRQQQLVFQARRNPSLGFMYYVNIIQTFLGIPAMFVSMCCDFLASDEATAGHIPYSTWLFLNFFRKFTGVCTFLCLCTSSIALWCVIYNRASSTTGKPPVNFMTSWLNDVFGWKVYSEQKSSLDTEKNRTFWTASNVYYMTGQTYYTLLYVRKVFHCFVPTLLPDHVACFFAESLLQNFIIDPYLMIIVPVLNWVLIADVGLDIFWVSYSLNLAVLLILEIFVSKNDAIYRIAMTIMLCIFFIVDIRVRNVTMFFTAENLNQALKEVKRMEEENRKNEMRNMIANVAHDMKTVSDEIMFPVLFFPNSTYFHLPLFPVAFIVLCHWH